MSGPGPGYLLLRGNSRRIPLADGSVHCCVSSPPYWNLRDYGVVGQLGLEKTPEEYIEAMVAVFREVRRALRDDGTLYLNIGDSYNAYNGNRGASTSFSASTDRHLPRLPKGHGLSAKALKPKDLVGIPWMLAFALRDDGWYLRQTIIWDKPNGMTESVEDRPPSAMEPVFLFSKRPRYFYDWYACASLSKTGTDVELPEGWALLSRLRNVWKIPVKGFNGAHFATMPDRLAARCIKLGTSAAGCCPACGSPLKRIVEKRRFPTRPGVNSKVNGPPPGSKILRSAEHRGDIDPEINWRNSTLAYGNRDTGRHITAYRHAGWESSCTCVEARNSIPCRVYDPFGGAMTTVVAAESLGRAGIATELNPDYIAIGRRRIERPHARPARAVKSESAPSLFSNLDD